LGRSSLRMASIRCSRVWLAAAGTGRADMVNSCWEESGGISGCFPRLPRGGDFPPKESGAGGYFLQRLDGAGRMFGSGRPE
jgi:hypothetical protein